MNLYEVNWYFKILRLSPLICSGDTGAGISREEFIGNIAQDVVSKLPTPYDLDKIRKKYGLDVTPTTVVLLQEIERFNKLINRMERSLKELKRVSCVGSTWQNQRLHSELWCLVGTGIVRRLQIIRFQI